MDYYGAVESHMVQDIYIKKWIEIILMSLSEDENRRPRMSDDNNQEIDYTKDLGKEDRQALLSLIEETQ